MPTPITTHDAVAEAYDKLEAAGSVDPAQEAAPEPAVATPAAPEPQGQPEPEPAQDGRVRDPKGRFQKSADKPAAPVAPTGPAPTVAATTTVAPVLPELKAPQNWKAAAREKWAAIPREIQEESLRVHAEVMKTMDESAAARKEAAAWRETLASHEPLFRQHGLSPHQAVGTLLQSYAALTSSNPRVRAQAAAAIVRQYIGTDEQALTPLAEFLAGAGVTEQHTPRAFGEAEVEALLARREAERAQAGAMKAWQDFEASAPEFLREPGMRASIAELWTLWRAQNPGQPETREVFQKLYDRAVSLNEETAKITKQREDAKKAATVPVTATPAAAASAGLKNEPAGPTGGPKPKSTREEVERQYDRLSRVRV